MDITERKITKIAREVSKFTVRQLREEGVGASEFDVIHAVRKNPGITQAGVCRITGLDKGAVARQAANLEAKGYIVRKDNEDDGRQPGRRHEGGGGQQGRRGHGVHGHEHGGSGRRHECTGPVRHGSAADRPAGGVPARRLDLLLWPYRQHRQVLRRVRRTQARTGGGMEVLLRRGEHRQILRRMRQAQTCRRVDLLLRQRQQGQVLRQLRQSPSLTKCDM